MKTSDISDEVVCAAYVSAKEQRGVFADGVLEARLPDCPPKVIYSAMERAHRRGLIEYGVSLRAGWLTDEGAALVATKDPTP